MPRDEITILEHDSVAVLFDSGDPLKSSIANCTSLGTLSEAGKAIAEARERLDQRLTEIAQRKLALTMRALIA